MSTGRTIYPSGKGLKTLLVKGFDDEQIWAQLQAHQTPLLLDLKEKIAQLDTDSINVLKNQYIQNVEEADVEEEQNDSEDEVDDRALRRAMTNNYEDSEGEDSDDEPAPKKKARNDDDDEMIQKEEPMPEDIDDFINQMENKLDDIDEFEFDEEDKEEFTRDDAQAMSELYGDDFDEEEEDDDDDEPEDDGPKSMFEQHQQKLLEEIEKMEERNIADKDWQETGETASMKRPKNSLLDADLAFEHSSLKKPIITEEITKDLESIIINRIVTGIFDDPEAPDLDDKKENLKNEAELRHEKSKKSLAQVYEEMYLKKVEGVDVEEEERSGDPIILKNKDRVRQSVAATIHTLNKMSSFHYVPPPIVKESAQVQKRKGDIIAVDVEASRDPNNREEQAPQEIISSVKWLPQGENEMEQQDRKRKRRTIKEQSKKKFKSAKELVDQIATGGKKQRERLSKELQESKGIDTDQRGFTSSKKFFNAIADNLQKHGEKRNKKSEPAPEDSSSKKAYKMRL